MYKILYSLLFAFIISVVWMTFGRKMYDYNKGFPKIFGLSIFPLIGWTLGLFVLSLIYFLLSSYLSIVASTILSILIYWVLLVLAEYVGYHVFGVHNEAASRYPGLYPRIPLLDCHHAPLWMKIVYFALGPVMILSLILLL